MILVMLGVSCLLFSGAWYIYKSTVIDLGLLQIDSNAWLLFSWAVSLSFAFFYFRKFGADKGNKSNQLKLNTCLCLFALCNLLQWDLNHSGWGIGSDAKPIPGLFGVCEPLCFDFLYTPPRVSDRLTSCFHASPEESTLWADYKAGKR